ncbi:BREX-1 system adenine-specific DNA-methyltransferase PglX [Ectopseudomonas mendocina]
MNRSALKKYAPQARLDFIEAVTLRARRLGLDPTLPVSVEQTGDVLLIAGQPFPVSVAKQRSELARRIQQQGFSAVVEALAYTWFNRLVAIRFMELKGYLSHGYRVLSHPQGQQPEILDHVQHLDLPGLDKEEVIRLKTAGNQDEALYREILLAQCHELHRNMPFLFEALDDATELLLPDNLLRTDSPIAHLVSDIEEADWQEVEVIGWLYQFYISDKKDEVIGKVVKSEDIPAATQLFTPNWIVQYLVQNSLGRLWLMANPGSNLKDKMPYYIEPAEQTPEVQAQLDALIKVRMDEDGGTLNPESLTVLDPACGSGHILVEAYNLLRAIYEERGYRLREIPRLILQKNLYGLDIDDRAAQLAGFALLMKAREDDRRLFDEEGNPPHLNVMAIQESAGLPDEEMARVILNAAIQIEGGDAFHSGQLFGGGQLETQHSSGLTVLDLRQLIKLFEHGKTFGSLISVPDALKAKLGPIVHLLSTVRSKGDDLARSYAGQVLEHFAWPASLLALHYDAVVANPPYMGNKAMNAVLKDFSGREFCDSKTDLFSMFINRGFAWCKESGFNSMITMDSWMFAPAYIEFRQLMLRAKSIAVCAHLGAHAFDSISGEIVSTVAFVSSNHVGQNNVPVFCRLVSGKNEYEKSQMLLSAKWVYSKQAQENFFNIIGSPLAYWLSPGFIGKMREWKRLGDLAEPRSGLTTGDNGRFLRFWFEVEKFNKEIESINYGEGIFDKWVPLNGGSSFRKWYGSNLHVINWENKGFCLRNNDAATMANPDFQFKPGVTWSKISGSSISVRRTGPGFVFSAVGLKAFPAPEDINFVCGLLNSNIVQYLVPVFSSNLTILSGDIAKYPIPQDKPRVVSENVEVLCNISKNDWDSCEVSWDFKGHPFVFLNQPRLVDAFKSWEESSQITFDEMKRLEQANNSALIEAYGLRGEVSPDVPDEKITLTRAERVKDMQSFISYVMGCMMGRYSLDEPGLIYAQSGNIDFDPSRYTKFPADSDGIIPITDETWFEDDAAERVGEFVKVVWGAETLVENMEWLADSLGRKAGESADEAVRRYLSTSFYKDHLQTYKKRPIYWLFSSGKQKAFECLVYLHRYNEGTLSRMRMEYVVPLQSRMQARIDKLTDDIDSTTSSAQQKALQKRKDKLTKQLEELRRFDENLRPYADQRITLDLDDGVKVNYGKFGNLLAEVKAITGGKEE